MNKAATLLILIFLVAPLCVTTAVPTSVARSASETTDVQNNVPLNVFQEASAIQRDVRVALYDESNTTAPSYSYSGLWTTNVTEIEILLNNAGFDVTRLTAAEIDGSDTLRTALFDVFIMVDNNPRESITDEVLNFWKGGGGILSFDGVISFLCYFGVMVPDSLNDNGIGTYWTYSWSATQTVMSRHPVSQHLMIGDNITDNLDWAAFDWSALQGFSYSDEYTPITHATAGTNWVNTLARDTVLGGRVVQTFGDANPIADGQDQIIIDAINWLCPRPKARVAFDYTHQPYYGIDANDPYLGYNSADRYAEWRDALVNRTFTVDKLYPSPEGNLTAENLAPYDVIVINTPLVNFSAAEVQAVTNWVSQGGGLILLGDYNTFSEQNANMNYLLSNFDMSLTSTMYTVGSFTTTEYEIHPTVESVTSTYYAGGVYLNITGDAYPLWYDGPNIVSAAREYGSGRVYLCGDINAFAVEINNAANMQYSINLVNWISSGSAPVLLYVDEPWSANYYRTPVALALNELALDYYLTSDAPYLNLSLSLREWYLVIVDNPWPSIYEFYLDFDEYIQSGGRFLMSGYQVSSRPNSPLWSTLGFGFAGPSADSVPLYVWDESASIFNIPHQYGAANFTPFTDYGDEGDMLNVLGNATAIAGFSPTSQSGNASIVVRNDGMTVYNGYLIDEFSNDLDDSTYADNFELWLNEIAFLLRPSIDHPSDVEFTEGTPGHSITWTPTSVYPAGYHIRINGSLAEQDLWHGGPIAFSVDNLVNGTHVVVITAMDKAGYTVTDEVIVTVTPTTPTTTAGLPPINPTLVIVILAAAGVAVVIIIVLMKQRSRE
jgi:hypothetical protein